jgi:hypothetical protein
LEEKRTHLEAEELSEKRAYLSKSDAHCPVAALSSCQNKRKE